MSTERALQVIEGEYRDITPVVTPEKAKEAMQLYQEVAKAITDENDYQTFRDSDGKEHKFRKRSGWKKLERFFFVSVEIKDERIFHAHNPNSCLRVRMPEHFKDVTDCGCAIKGVRIVARATDTRTGRFSENVGICTAGEKRVSNSSSMHDLATRAFNRAANRAVADLIGISDPSAEEVQAEQGFSREEKLALRQAWDEAGAERQNEAIQAMSAAGAAGNDARQTYVAFLKVANDNDYATVMAVLKGTYERFDPDEVPPE